MERNHRREDMNAKDLKLEPPRSARERIGEYAILARAIDKCRAASACMAGDYHYGCPLDRMLFTFKGITASEFKRAVNCGRSDEELAEWLNQNGIFRTPEEISAWSEEMERYSPYHDPQKRYYFIAECEKLGLDPAATSAFDWLELDDQATFAARV